MELQAEKKLEENEDEESCKERGEEKKGEASEEAGVLQGKE